MKYSYRTGTAASTHSAKVIFKTFIGHNHLLHFHGVSCGRYFMNHNRQCLTLFYFYFYDVIKVSYQRQGQRHITPSCVTFLNAMQHFDILVTPDISACEGRVGCLGHTLSDTVIVIIQLAHVCVSVIQSNVAFNIISVIS